MAEFHKSCYTSRSAGYKYRTLSTNTGEYGRRVVRDDNIIEKKFRELKDEIAERVDEHIEASRQTREQIHSKFHKIDDKINNMLALKDIMASLQSDLHNAAAKVLQLGSRIDHIEYSIKVILDTSPSGLSKGDEESLFKKAMIP